MSDIWTLGNPTWTVGETLSKEVDDDDDDAEEESTYNG